MKEYTKKKGGGRDKEEKEKSTIYPFMRGFAIFFAISTLFLIILAISDPFSSNSEETVTEMGKDCPKPRAVTIRHNASSYPTLFLTEQCWSNPRLKLTTPVRAGYRDHYRFVSDPPGAYVLIRKNNREIIGPVSIDSIQRMRQVHSLQFRLPEGSGQDSVRIFVNMERYRIRIN